MSIRLSQAYSLGKQKRGKYFSNHITYLETKFVESKDILDVPGPGHYKPSVNQTKGKINPSWSLSKEQKDKMFSHTSPGPGQYQIPSKVQEGPKHIVGEKLNYNKLRNQTKPGPGLYDPKKPEMQVSYSIVKRNDTVLSKEKRTPGPGHYLDIRQQHYENIAGSLIGKDTRKSTFLKTAAYGKPSPTTYKTFSFTDKQQAPKFGIGTSLREKDYLQSPMMSTLPPGPGHYNLESALGDGKPVSLVTGRLKDLRPKTGRDAPGAGSYNPDYKNLRKSSPSFSLTKQTRDGELGVFQNTPGCGDYFGKDTLTKNHSATWRIGSEQRPRNQQFIPKTPGPGKYNMFSTLQGPKYPISIRQDKACEQSPGPGSYKITHDYTTKLNRAPSFSVGSQQRVTIKELNRNPGPGVYPINKSRQQSEGPKYGFGSSQRMPVKKGREPGPGSYQIPTQVANVPVYSMPNRDSTYKFV